MCSTRTAYSRNSALNIMWKKLVPATPTSAERTMPRRATNQRRGAHEGQRPADVEQRLPVHVLRRFGDGHEQGAVRHVEHDRQRAQPERDRVQLPQRQQPGGACNPNSMLGTHCSAVRQPICAPCACSTSTAVSGSATEET
jgi:hypothetical protein